MDDRELMPPPPNPPVFKSSKKREVKPPRPRPPPQPPRPRPPPQPPRPRPPPEKKFDPKKLRCGPKVKLPFKNVETETDVEFLMGMFNKLRKHPKADYSDVLKAPIYGAGISTPLPANHFDKPLEQPVPPIKMFTSHTMDKMRNIDKKEEELYEIDPEMLETLRPDGVRSKKPLYYSVNKLGQYYIPPWQNPKEKGLEEEGKNEPSTSQLQQVKNEGQMNPLLPSSPILAARLLDPNQITPLVDPPKKMPHASSFERYVLSLQEFGTPLFGCSPQQLERLFEDHQQNLEKEKLEKQKQGKRNAAKELAKRAAVAKEPNKPIEPEPLPFDPDRPLHPTSSDERRVEPNWQARPYQPLADPNQRRRPTREIPFQRNQQVEDPDIQIIHSTHPQKSVVQPRRPRNQQGGKLRIERPYPRIPSQERSAALTHQNRHQRDDDIQVIHSTVPSQQNQQHQKVQPISLAPIVHDPMPPLFPIGSPLPFQSSSPFLTPQTFNSRLDTFSYPQSLFPVQPIRPIPILLTGVQNFNDSGVNRLIPSLTQNQPKPQMPFAPL